MGRRIDIVIEHEGEKLGFRELADRVHLDINTIRQRWYCGDRGADLTRPLGTQSSRKLKQRQAQLPSNDPIERTPFPVELFNLHFHRRQEFSWRASAP